MRLYMNKQGEWVGTQAEAKKIKADMVDVPTDKPNLLKWLNTFTGAIDDAAKHQPIVMKDGRPALVLGSNLDSKPDPGTVARKPHKYDFWDNIRDVAENCSLTDFNVALAVFMDRVHDIADKQKETQQ